MNEATQAIYTHEREIYLDINVRTGLRGRAYVAGGRYDLMSTLPLRPTISLIDGVARAGSEHRPSAVAQHTADHVQHAARLSRVVGLGHKVGSVRYPATFRISNLPDLTAPCTQRYFTSRCLTLPSPCPLAIDLAADESTQTRTLSSQPKSAAKDWRPSPSAAAWANAYNSA